MDYSTAEIARFMRRHKIHEECNCSRCECALAETDVAFENDVLLLDDEMLCEECAGAYLSARLDELGGDVGFTCAECGEIFPPDLEAEPGEEDDEEKDDDGDILQYCKYCR